MEINIICVGWKSSYRKLAKDIEHVVGATEDPNSNWQGSRKESPRKLHTKIASTDNLAKVLEGRD